MHGEFTAYFAFGGEGKTLLISQFCREHDYQHVRNPIAEAFNQGLTKTTIIEGSVQVFHKIEGHIKDIRPIFIGTEFSAEQLQIRRQYTQIGRAIHCRSSTYNQLRKGLYPQLIFIYGPVNEQNTAVSGTLANNIKFLYAPLPQDANTLIKTFNKTENYVINGLFESHAEISVLQEFFNFKIVHLQYNRIDLPSNSAYFDREFQLLAFLKSKNYYLRVDGSKTPVDVMDQVGIKLCPEFIGVNANNSHQKQYLLAFIKEKDQLLLSMHEIKEILTRKHEEVSEHEFDKLKLLNSIIYKNLHRKRIFLLDFPQHVSEIIAFENMNRKFSKFLDLTDVHSHNFSGDFTNQIYFLEQQKRVAVNTTLPLSDQLDGKIQYWIVSGPSCSGKTTVSKFLAAQHGFKLIEFEPYLASVKQKLIAPEDGEQLPLKKVVAHFKGLLQNDQSTYVIDGFPYDNKELIQWIAEIGSPTILNLKLEADELTKRTRKKNQADLNAEVGEEEKAKIAQALAKNNGWLDRLKEISPLSLIHVVDFASPLIISQKAINKIFKARIYLVQRHTQLVYQNISIKYNLGFVNLDQNKLRDCASIVGSLKKKDVILCYYDQQEQNLIIEDIYWIEKYLGDIRYIGIWRSEPTKLEKEKYMLQKPVQQEKPKAEGAEGEEKPPEQPPADQPIKKDFDIYAVEWSKNEIHENISQWFHQTKKNIISRENGAQVLFEEFGDVIKEIQAGKNVYEVGN